MAMALVRKPHCIKDTDKACLTGVNNTNEALLGRTNIIVVYFISVTNTNNAYLTGVDNTVQPISRELQYVFDAK
jgi:hypothetical protein